MSDVVPYLDEAMQWATDAVIDYHFFSKIALVENVVAMGIPSFYKPFFAKKYPFRVSSFNSTLFKYLVTLHPFLLLL